MANNSSARGGTSTLTVLLIVFVVLKLTDNIDWSWFWVLSPFTIPVGLILGIAVLYCVVVFMLRLLKTLRQFITRTRPKSNLDAAFEKLIEEEEKGKIN